MHAMPISKNYGIEGSFIVEKFVQDVLQFAYDVMFGDFRNKVEKVLTDPEKSVKKKKVFSGSCWGWPFCWWQEKL